jgi:hypothetical protein
LDLLAFLSWGGFLCFFLSPRLTAANLRMKIEVKQALL